MRGGLAGRPAVQVDEDVGGDRAPGWRRVASRQRDGAWRDHRVAGYLGEHARVPCFPVVQP